MTRPLIRMAIAVTAAAGLANTALAAIDYGTIVGKTPVFTALSVPQTQCAQQEQPVHPPTTGGGAVAGAAVVGSLANALGGGSGRAALTGLGVIGGAILGDRLEANASPPVATAVQRCQVVAQVQNQLVGYDVTYDFRGQRYSARVASDPGPAGGVIVLNADATPVATTVLPPPSLMAPPVMASTPGVAYATPPVVIGAPLLIGPVRQAEVDFGYGWGRHRWH